MAVIKDKKCMIIGAAPLASGAVFEEFDPKEHYVICADAGYDTAMQYGVRPDLVIGDFDSAAKRPPETIRTIYAQQKYMYDHCTHSTSDRIVSVSQPLYGPLPIIRGKARKRMEFGAKPDISVVNGRTRLGRPNRSLSVHAPSLSGL